MEASPVLSWIMSSPNLYLPTTSEHDLFWEIGSQVTTRLYWTRVGCITMTVVLMRTENRDTQTYGGKTKQRQTQVEDQMKTERENGPMQLQAKEEARKRQGRLLPENLWKEQSPADTLILNI